MIDEKMRAQILGGAMQETNGGLAGFYNEFYIVVEDRRSQYAVTINAHEYNDLGNQKLGEFLEKLKGEQKQLSEVEVKDYFVKLVIALPYVSGSIPEVVNGILYSVLDYLKQEGYESGCKECGEPVSLFDYRQIEGSYCYTCGHCAKKHEKTSVNTQSQYQQSYADVGISSQSTSNYNFVTAGAIKEYKKSNVITGMLGAILGSIPGIALWIIVGKLGYIVAIIGALIGAGALFGYKLLGRSLDRRGVVLTTIWVLIAVYLSNHIAVTWTIYDEVKYFGITFGEIFTSLLDLMRDFGVMREFIMDLLFGYVFTIACIAKPFINAFNDSDL